MLNCKLFYRLSAIHSKICIVGGGSGGLNISSHLLKTFPGSDLRIFQPSSIHYYQPSWTMIGGDLVESQVSFRQNKEVLSKEIPLTVHAVTKIEPDKNLLHTNKGETYSYEHLIVATGTHLNWDKIKGAKEAVEDPSSAVTSIYTFAGAQKTRILGRKFAGGRAIFTEPELPIKCAGAPQKILYLLTDKWKKRGLNFTVQFNKVADVMFGVPKYSQALVKVAKDYGIDVRLKRKLIEVKKDQKIAVFQKGDQVEEEKFDFLHLVPPMKPAAFLAESGLTDAQGYVDVDKHTLRHNKYPNVWALGDNSSLPCSKTAAAIFSQTPVLVENIKRVILQKEEPTKKYDGYASCPIFVGDKKLILAEFKYGNEVSETFFNDQEKPRRVFYHLKKDFFPFAYWNLVPKGIWAGRNGIKIQ